MNVTVNTALFSGRVRLHVLAKNDYPSSGPTTEIQKEGYAVQLHFSFENLALTS